MCKIAFLLTKSRQALLDLVYPENKFAMFLKKKFTNIVTVTKKIVKIAEGKDENKI